MVWSGYLEGLSQGNFTVLVEGVCIYLPSYIHRYGRSNEDRGI